jgi:hypothetical protein
MLALFGVYRGDGGAARKGTPGRFLRVLRNFLVAQVSMGSMRNDALRVYRVICTLFSDNEAANLCGFVDFFNGENP